MIHVIFVLVLYSILAGWIANIQKKTIFLSSQNKEDLGYFHTLSYYFYSMFNVFINDKTAVVVVFTIATISNLLLIEYYWYRYRKVINILLDSIIFRVLKVAFFTLIVSGSILLAGLILEEITKVPSSTINNHVILFSFAIMLIVGLFIAIFALELIFPFTAILLAIIDKERVENKINFIMSVLIFLVPLLTFVQIATKLTFNQSIVSEVLYYTYHENNDICSNIPKSSRFMFISSNEISIVSYDDITKSYKFTVGLCNKKA